jgi:hypothetical protein
MKPRSSTRNPLEIDPMEPGDARVVETIEEGRTIFIHVVRTPPRSAVDPGIGAQPAWRLLPRVG